MARTRYSIWKCHVIWYTKYWKKVLIPQIAERAGDLIRQGCAARGVVIVQGAVSPDHIPFGAVGAIDSGSGEAGPLHQGAIIPPLAGSISGVAKTLMRAAHAGTGYFCATVGAVGEATIKAYIESQRWDGDDELFRIAPPTKP
jgi:putative transposase